MESMSTIKEQRDYAWDYFQLHAGQRMSTFNYFIVLAALLTTGLAGTFVKDFKWNMVSTVLGLGLMVVSFAFWKLDQRVRFLIKHAESSLRQIEQKWTDEVARDGAFFANLFCKEQTETDRNRGQQNYRFWAWDLSYSNCFEIVYCFFGVLGLLGALASLLR
jgi:hypothetical protein